MKEQVQRSVIRTTVLYISKNRYIILIKPQGTGTSTVPVPGSMERPAITPGPLNLKYTILAASGGLRPPEVSYVRTGPDKQIQSVNLGLI